MREKRNEYTISISEEILKSANLTNDQVRNAVVDLTSIFGKKADLVVPNKINDLPTLCSVVDTARRLNLLRNCEGFDKHVKVYARNQVRPHMFVTTIASFLVDKVEKVVLEPSIKNKGKVSDILLLRQSEQLYLECKSIQPNRFEFGPEHEQMFEVLRHYIKVPHQVSITYKASMKENELHKLGESLSELLPKVTSPGHVISDVNLEVQVIPRDAYGSKNISLRMGMISVDLSTNCRYPGDVFGRDGLTVSICGPLVDYKGVLRKSLRALTGKPQTTLPFY